MYNMVIICSVIYSYLFIWIPRYAWNFAQMDTIGSLKEFRNKSRDVCRMSYKEAIKYRDHMNTSLYNLNGNSALTDTLLPYYCFLSAYSLLLLQGDELLIALFF